MKPDQTARREARAINRAADISLDTCLKTGAFGLYATCLQNGYFPLEPLQSRTLDGIESELTDRLYRTAYGGYNSLDRVSRGIIQMHAPFQPITNMDGSKLYGSLGPTEEFHGGARTAALTEVIMLRTMANRGYTVTHDGLYNHSFPYNFAIRVHRRDLMDVHNALSIYDKIRQGRLYDETVVPSACDGHLQFPSRFINLYFPASPDEDPLVGCPATFVKDLIPNIHKLAADAALAGGLIKLSEQE